MPYQIPKLFRHDKLYVTCDGEAASQVEESAVDVSFAVYRRNGRLGSLVFLFVIDFLLFLLFIVLIFVFILVLLLVIVFKL